MEENVVWIAGSDSFQFFFHVFGHLPAEGTPLTCSLHFYTLWDVSSLFLSSVFPFRLIFLCIFITCSRRTSRFSRSFWISLSSCEFPGCKGDCSVRRLFICPVSSSVIWFSSRNFLDLSLVKDTFKLTDQWDSSNQHLSVRPGGSISCFTLFL